MRSWAHSLVRLYNVDVEIDGLEHVDPQRPVIYMPNHASMVDIVVLIHSLPVDLRFIFKKSLLYVPVLGQAIHFMGMVPIDRSNMHKATESLRNAGRQIRAGSHVLIFPEGTRTRTGNLLPFKKGGFYLAIQEKIDIVPISINNSQSVGGVNSILIRTGCVKVRIHPPVRTSEFNLETRHALIRRVRETIDSGLEGSYRKEENAEIAPPT
jgi:1-acyl-sn-glycerol-3-phosphate acyltransferase